METILFLVIGGLCGIFGFILIKKIVNQKPTYTLSFSDFKEGDLVTITGIEYERFIVCGIGMNGVSLRSEKDVLAGFMSSKFQNRDTWEYVFKKWNKLLTKHPVYIPYSLILRNISKETRDFEESKKYVRIEE